MPIEGPTEVLRQFIPEGEELTPAEKARHARNIPQRLDVVTPNFIPDPKEEVVEQLDREEVRARNHQRAAEAAARRAERSDEFELEVASRKLTKLSATAAADFVKDLSPSLKSVYARAEMDGQGRATVLKALRGFLPEE